jgi:hypothetical protein
MWYDAARERNRTVAAYFESSFLTHSDEMREAIIQWQSAKFAARPLNLVIKSVTRCGTPIANLR